MKRWKLWIFGVLAVAGTAGGMVYAVAVAPGAKTKFEAAVLFFTAAAAVTGFLGLIVSWLSYRLEAGRVPKPDLAIVSDGELVRRWDLEIELLDPEPDVVAEVRQERQRLEAVIERLRRPAKSAPTTLAAAVLGSAWTAGQVSDEAITNYQKAGDDLEWHHVVEQTPGNIERFGAETVHDPGNVVRLAASTHRLISSYYSSIQEFTGGVTVRSWLSGQSFADQMQFGLRVLRGF